MIETSVNKQTKIHLEKKKCHCCVFAVFSLLPVLFDIAEGEGSVTCTALLRLCAFHIRMQCAADTGMGFVFK